MEDFRRFMQKTLTNPYEINDYSGKAEVVKWMEWEADLAGPDAKQAVSRSFWKFDKDDHEQNLYSWVGTAKESLFEWGLL